MSIEYRVKEDVPNLYNILGLTIDVCKDSDCDEKIKQAYFKKAKVCHPDKHRGKSEKKIKEIGEIFELLTMAYDLLKDEKQRDIYNQKLQLNKQSSGDFFKLKKQSVDHVKAVGEFLPATDQQKLSFKEQMKTLDSKHGYDTFMDGPMGKNDAKKKMQETLKERASQDQNLLPEKLFDGSTFINSKFQALFDRVHIRDDNGIVPHNGVPSAWNDLGTVANYSSFDDLDNLYVEDSGRLDVTNQLFGDTNFGKLPHKKVSRDDIENISGADYVTNHNVLGDDYYRDIKDRLKERKTDASKIENMNYGDFKKDDMAGYGIFDQLGINAEDKLSLDDDDNISRKFEKLMAERQRDVNSSPDHNIGKESKSSKKMKDSR